VAWYNLGFKPGQTGNAVFAGHFDKPDGSPSIFYKLGSLEKGDLIEVQDSSGSKEFKVTEVRVVDLASFPLQEVFGEVNKKQVNLITCGGVWDKQKKEYSERTVVFSELVT
jgi:LPXTG-site transpeptidase (sortase) family protein